MQGRTCSGWPAATLASHAHRVAVTLGDHLVAHVERVDAGSGEHRFVGDGLHLLGEVDELAFGNDLVRHGTRSLVEAGLHAPSVHAVLLDDRDDLEGVLDAVAVRHEVVGGDAHQDGHVVAAGLVDLVDDLAQEAGAVLGASAVLVGAMVGVLGQEAHHHVADAGMDLDDVDAAVLGALGRFAVLLHHDGDLFFGVFALGHAHERAAGNVFGRSVGQQRVGAARTPLVAQLQLRGHLRAMLMARLGDALPTRVELVGPNAAGSGGGVILRLGIEAIADVRAADLDQAHAALGALLVEVHQVVRNMIVVDLLDRHGQHDEPVPDLHPADAERFQQLLILCHDANPFPLLNSAKRLSARLARGRSVRTIPLEEHGFLVAIIVGSAKGRYDGQNFHIGKSS